MPRPLTIRWTIGDVSDFGFEALALGMRGAVRLFGTETDYVVCVNTLTVDDARRRLGLVPPNVRFRQSRAEQAPQWIRQRLDGGFAQGAAWKFAPLRIAPDGYELSLDKNAILWRIPLEYCRDRPKVRQPSGLYSSGCRRCRRGAGGWRPSPKREPIGG